MNNNSLEHLNQITNFINEKGIYITFDDREKINLELDKLMKIISKKENLKKIWRIIIIKNWKLKKII